MFDLDLNLRSVIGEDGICFSFDMEGRPPIIPVQIKSDSGKWTWIDFILDTGADFTIMHADVASKYGLDVSKHDLTGCLSCVGGVQTDVYYRKGVLLRIGHFPAVPITIGYSPNIRPDLRILGRETILSLFGITFYKKGIGIFTNHL